MTEIQEAHDVPKMTPEHENDMHYVINCGYPWNEAERRSLLEIKARLEAEVSGRVTVADTKTQFVGSREEAIAFSESLTPPETALERKILGAFTRWLASTESSDILALEFDAAAPSTTETPKDDAL